MSGVNGVVGFIFAFLMISGGVLFYFMNLIDAIEGQNELKNLADKTLSSSYIQIEQQGSHYGSDRLRFFIKNGAPTNIKLKDDNENCMDVFINNQYLNSSYFDIYLLSPKADYFVIGPYEEAVLDINYNFPENSEIEIDLSTCQDYKETFYIENSSSNWLDEDFSSRTLFNISEDVGSNQFNKIFNISLNTTNFNFSTSNKYTIRLLLPIYENTIIDTTFDKYEQTISEYSKYNNEVFLGASALSAINDPSIEEDAVFFNGLLYDGVDDFNVITLDNSLEADSSLTYSAWVKWTGNGSSSQYIFRNGRDDNHLRIINDGSIDDGKVSFSLSISGVDRIINSNSILDNDWHLITGTYNGSQLKLYIDTTEENSLDITGSIDTTSDNNQIGTDTASAFFNGSIDDFKFLNIALSQDKIEELYLDKLTYIELNYSVIFWNSTTQKANLSVIIPYIRADENYNLEFYYEKDENERASESGDQALGEQPEVPPITQFWMSEDLTHDLGVDGTANQGTSPISLAQLITFESGVTSACIQGGGGGKANAIYAQQYTIPITSYFNITQNATGFLNVFSNNLNTVTWRITLVEYNNATGDIANIGTAFNTSTTTTNTNLSFIFNNSYYNITNGNIIKAVIDVTTSNGRPSLCYGGNTQSFFTFDRS